MMPKKINGYSHNAQNGPASQQLEENSGKTRYSDEELEEFKVPILKKLEKARYSLKMLTEAFAIGNLNDTSDTSPTFKVLEEGYQVNSKEENSKLAARQDKFITELENALVRIENKSYGICKVTGKLISKDRLRASPCATMEIKTKLNQKKDLIKIPHHVGKIK